MTAGERCDLVCTLSPGWERTRALRNAPRKKPGCLVCGCATELALRVLEKETDLQARAPDFLRAAGRATGRCASSRSSCGPAAAPAAAAAGWRTRGRWLKLGGERHRPRPALSSGRVWRSEAVRCGGQVLNLHYYSAAAHRSPPAPPKFHSERRNSLGTERRTTDRAAQSTPLALRLAFAWHKPLVSSPVAR